MEALAEVGEEVVDSIAVARLYGEPHAFLRDGQHLRRIAA